MGRSNTNRYIIIYTSILVIFVAALLAGTSTMLKSRQQANVLVEKKGAILSTIGIGKEGPSISESKSEYINNLYDKYITASFFVNKEGERQDAKAENVLNSLDNLPETFRLKTAMPLFEAHMDDGQIMYIVPMSGSGLWGPVWGYVALDSDFNTIAGAVFDHKGETPGLGAELSMPSFYNQFAGKKIFDGDKFVSVNLIKGDGVSKGNPHGVDAISGGTLTSNGIRDMLYDCFKAYVPFFEKMKQPKTKVNSDKAEINGENNSDNNKAEINGEDSSNNNKAEISSENSSDNNIIE